MKFALEIEGNVTDFYKEVSEYTKEDALRGLLRELYTRGQKRLNTLERVRRENVTEMILEPIEGLDSESFEFNTEISEGTDDATIKTLATSIESVLQKFYTAAAKKIEFLPEAEYAFELLAEKNEEAIKKLSG